MTTTLTVADRIASVSSDDKIVAGNTYTVAISTDAEWTGTYYLRIRFGSLYYDIPVSSSSVDVQIPVGYPEVGIGLYSDALSICTNEARIKVLRSILEQGVSVVEFDTDLYNQWLDEVSELVCDDAFDASSDKPLKNSVITTWKNSLPEYVTLSGSQSISGIKTFSTLRADNITLNGSADQFTIAKNSDNTVTMDVDANGMMFTGKLGGYDFPSALGFRIEDGVVCLVTNTYTGSSMLPVVNKQMLANDTSIVRVSGAQTIAGEKTFSDGIIFSQSSDTTATLITMDNGDSTVIKHVQIATDNNALIFNNTKGKCGTSLLVKGYSSDAMLGLGVGNVNPDDTTDTSNNWYCYCQSYYPMSGTTHLAPSEHIIMNSGMIAVDPRIVHTTGNEVVAGNKTFSGGVNVNSTFRKCFSSANLGTGWIRLYSIAMATSYAKQFLFTVRENYVPKNLAMKLALRVGATGGTDSGNTDSGYSFKLARKGTNVEIWVSRGTASSSIAMEFEYATANSAPVVDISSEQSNPPTVGVDDYTAVVDVEAW